jgi:hypothetical protein
MDPEKYLAFWDGVSIFEVRFGHLEDWLTWLSTEKKLSANTRKKVLDAFRVFLRWLQTPTSTRAGVPEVPSTSMRPIISERQAGDRGDSVERREHSWRRGSCAG